MHRGQLGDQLFITDLAIGGRARPGGSVASRGQKSRDCCPQHRADELDPELIAIGIDIGEQFVAGRSSSAAKNADAVFKISLALRKSATSRLSLRISACSELVVPGRSPASTWALRRHRRTDSCATPILLATDLMASNSEISEVSIVVSTNRSARWRNSGEYCRGIASNPPIKDRNKTWGTSQLVPFVGVLLTLKFIRVGDPQQRRPERVGRGTMKDVYALPACGFGHASVVRIRERALNESGQTSLS